MLLKAKVDVNVDEFLIRKFVWKREQVSYPPNLDTVIPESSHRDGKGGCASLVNWPWDPQVSLERDLGLHGYPQVARREPEPVGSCFSPFFLAQKSESASMYEHVWSCIVYLYTKPQKHRKVGNLDNIWETSPKPVSILWRLLNGYTNMFLHHPTPPPIQSPVMYVNMHMDGT